MAFIDQKALLDKTNGGLDIILKYYPQAEKALESRSKKFKIRDEKTASCSIKQLQDGTYVVTDFGGDQKPRNAISICMDEEKLSYKDALDYLAELYGIGGQSFDTSLLKPIIEKRPATDDEKPGEFYYTTRDFTEKELEIIGPFVSQERLNKYKLYALESYTTVKEGVAYIRKSTEHYPIFCFLMDGWFKKYEPLNTDKGYRFRYYPKGSRPKDFMFGLDILKAEYDKLNSDKLAQPEEEIPENKLKEVIICSGDRDALNVASMGFPVVWMNSETAKLTKKQWMDLNKYAEKIYILPDLDETGQRAAHDLAMDHLDLHVIELPKTLLKRKDWRGNPCKDVTDFVKWKQKSALYEFKQLVNTAMPYRMWDEIVKTDKSGNPVGIDYKFNNAHTYNFLQKNGFYRIQKPNDKLGYTYIQIVGNRVEEVTPSQIKDFVNTFLKERKMKVALRNLFFRSQNQLSENSLSNIERTELDFTDYTPSSQFIFFKNQTLEITAKGITAHKPGKVEKYIWDDEIIDHDLKLTDQPPFVISHNKKADRLTIKINDKKCLFLKYLHNTSRVHWRKEVERGEPLTDEERAEEELHLINKIYALGYLMHRYKDPSRPWCVFAMDNKVSEQGESHGGSGKSIAFKSVRYFMKHITLEGRNPKLTDNPHVFENVNHHTDYVLVDDANQYLKFDFFFSMLTGEMTINPKHGKQFTIEFQDVPKMAITSNFTLRNLDPSTERRLLYTVFSDYYHFNKDGEYQESRSPYDDFGKNLFLDFNEEEWNHFYNTMAHCLVTYLNYSKIDPPMDNVERRNLRTQMGDDFLEWADVYFHKDSGNTDCLYKKSTAFEAFKEATKNRMLTANKFKKKLQAWCKYYDFVLNPQQVTPDADGRIIRKGNDGLTHEYIYIKAYKPEITDTKKDGTTEVDAAFSGQGNWTDKI